MSENGATHVDEAIEAVADLERDAQDAISRHQRWIARVTNRIGQPLTFYLVVAFVALWIVSNLSVQNATGKTFDPPPFAYLQGMLTLSGLLVAILILTTANRVAQIDTQRDKLTLQINLLNERRTAKLIRMIDELRRDSPNLPTHDDPEVQQLSEPTNTQEVSRAIEERTPPAPPRSLTENYTRRDEAKSRSYWTLRKISSGIFPSSRSFAIAPRSAAIAVSCTK